MTTETQTQIHKKTTTYKTTKYNLTCSREEVYRLGVALDALINSLSPLEASYYWELRRTLKLLIGLDTP